jgi:hypothetical protein
MAAPSAPKASVDTIVLIHAACWLTGVEVGDGQWESTPCGVSTLRPQWPQTTMQPARLSSASIVFSQ